MKITKMAIVKIAFFVSSDWNHVKCEINLLDLL